MSIVQNKNETTLLFDFDGTIAETLELLVDIFNKWAKKLHFSGIDDQELEELRSMESEHMIKSFGIPLLIIPVIAKVIRYEMSRHIKEVDPVPEIFKVMRRLKDEGFRLGIVTSNNKKNVINFLNYHNASDIFEFVQSETSLFKKYRAILKTLLVRRIKKRDVIYIGDETRDIKAAKAAGIKIVSVSWGFNARSVLEDFEPEHIVDTPQDLLNLLV